MTHVVCLGDLMVDVVAQLPGPISIGSDRPAPITVHGGGAAANVASWVVAVGGAATFVGRIGDDSVGLQAIDQLTAAGVNPLVEIDNELPTGMCIVLVDDTGERSMIPSSGANEVGIDVGLLPTTAQWLYVSGYALLSDGARPGTLEAMAVARERGWALAVDAASAAPLTEAGATTFLDWVGTDVVLFANIEEARVLSGIGNPEHAAQALGRRCGQAVVKLGAVGAVWSDGVQTFDAPAPKVTVLDSTGAGDEFAAGFLVAEGTVKARLAAAVDVAASVVTRIGARPDPV